MKKLADISSFEALQNHAHAGFASDIAVFNTMDEAKRFVAGEGGGSYYGSPLPLLRKYLARISKPGESTEWAYGEDEEIVWSGCELCDWIEEGATITTDELAAVIYTELGEEVDAMLEATGQNEDAYKWIKRNFADELMDIASQEFEYRLDEHDDDDYYTYTDGFWPTFK